MFFLLLFTFFYSWPLQFLHFQRFKFQKPTLIYFFPFVLKTRKPLFGIKLIMNWNLKTPSRLLFRSTIFSLNYDRFLFSEIEHTIQIDNFNKFIRLFFPTLKLSFFRLFGSQSKVQRKGRFEHHFHAHVSSCTRTT